MTAARGHQTNLLALSTRRIRTLEAVTRVNRRATVPPVAWVARVTEDSQAATDHGRPVVADRPPLSSGQASCTGRLSCRTGRCRSSRPACLLTTGQLLQMDIRHNRTSVTDNALTVSAGRGEDRRLAVDSRVAEDSRRAGDRRGAGRGSRTAPKARGTRVLREGSGAPDSWAGCRRAG